MEYEVFYFAQEESYSYICEPLYIAVRDLKSHARVDGVDTWKHLWRAGPCPRTRVQQQS